MMSRRYRNWAAQHGACIARDHFECCGLVLVSQRDLGVGFEARVAWREVVLGSSTKVAMVLGGASST